MIRLAIGMALVEIRRNAMRSFLTMLGVVIGVAAVVTMLTLGQSATDKVTSDVSSLGNNLLMVRPGADERGPPTNTATPFDAHDVRAVRAAVGDDADVAPVASGSAILVVGNLNHSTSITGTTPAYATVRGYEIARGRMFTDAEDASGRAVCVLGETVITELFGASDPLGATMRVGRVSCTVIGTLTPKGGSAMGQDQDDVVWMPLGAYQRRVAGDDAVQMMYLGVHDSDDLDRVVPRVASALRETRRISPGGTDDFQVSDLREIADTLSTITTVLTAFLGAVGGVSLLVGGIGIMNIMLVSVTERTREIGVRLAIGARPGDILTQFLVESVVLSVLGGAIGIAVGLSGSWLITWGLGLGWSPSLLVVGGAFLFCTWVGVGFGYLPARRASQLDPLEALRHE